MAKLDKNFLLINKPAGWTSFDVVNYVRKTYRKHFVNSPLITASRPPRRRGGGRDPARGGTVGLKIGHAGTLDPFATGLLIVGAGREATKRLDEFKNLPKTYVATLHLGAVSDTGDVTGRINATAQHVSSTTQQHFNTARLQHNNNLTIEQLNNVTYPNKMEIELVLNSFLGKQLQTPPMYSAKSVGGVRLYKLARQGITIERQPNEIEILDIKLLEYSYPLLKIEVACSSGTYIRTLAEDIGKKLKVVPRPGSGRPCGVGAYCEELVRTRIGDFKLEDAKAPDEI